MPAEQWEALDAEAIKEEYSALAVMMNGPRFFLMDELTSFAERGEIAMFGELEMYLAAQVQVSPNASERGAYTESLVERDTEYVFLSSNPVYELIAPEGQVYVMQSYSHIVDHTLTEESLSTLDEHLDLPAGWTYRVRLLEEDLHLRADGTALVVQDEFANSYQRVERACNGASVID